MRVFVSYSPLDEQRQRELLRHLAPAIRAGLVSPWDPSQLVPGDELSVISEAELGRAEVALVLLSAAYLDTGGPADRELVPIMARHHRDGLRVVPIVLSACDWQNEPRLKSLQVLPRDGRPLDERAEALVQVCREIAALGTQPAPAAPPAVAAAAARVEPPAPPDRRRVKAVLQRLALPLALGGLALLLVVRFFFWPGPLGCLFRDPSCTPTSLRADVAVGQQPDAAARPAKDAVVPAAATPTPPVTASTKVPGVGPAAASPATSTARAAPATINSDNKITDSRGAKLRNHAKVPKSLGQARINSGNEIKGSEGAQMDNSVEVTP